MSSKILYDYGTDNTSVTGGFVFKGNYVSQATVLKNTDCIYMKNGNFGSYNFLMCETTNPIDLTDYTELKAELTCPTSNPSDYSRFGIGKEPITNNYGGVALVSDPIGKIGSKQIVTLDISNIDGFYYINLMADNGNEMIIHKVWLDGGSDIPDTPSRLAGTNAVAIAYAIARNQESTAALQEMKKAYREGTVNGDDGNGDVTEPYKTTDPDEPMPFPKDGGSTINTDDAITDLTKGYWFACGDRDTETVNYYVKVWIEPYYYEYDYVIRRNKIYAAVYKADGTQIGSITDCEYQYWYSKVIDRIETAIRAQIAGKSLLVWRWVTNSNGNNGFEQATVCQLTNLSLGAIVWSGNVSPFI